MQIERPDEDHISTRNCSRTNLLVLVFQKLDQQMRSPYAKYMNQLFKTLFSDSFVVPKYQRDNKVLKWHQTTEIQNQRNRTSWNDLTSPKNYRAHLNALLYPISPSSPKQCKNSHHCPVCIVMFWLPPRKNYIFLCLSGSLFFSVCDRKK